MNETEIRIKRLKYRSWHRGCKETDVILGPFAEKHLHELTTEQLITYEQFLEETDTEIWNWLVEKDTQFDPKYAWLIARLRRFTQETHAA